jgi:hypothetical protein
VSQRRPKCAGPALKERAAVCVCAGGRSLLQERALNGFGKIAHTIALWAPCDGDRSQRVARVLFLNCEERCGPIFFFFSRLACYSLIFFCFFSPRTLQSLSSYHSAGSAVYWLPAGTDTRVAPRRS